MKLLRHLGLINLNNQLFTYWISAYYFRFQLLLGTILNRNLMQFKAGILYIISVLILKNEIQQIIWRNFGIYTYSNEVKARNLSGKQMSGESDENFEGWRNFPRRKNSPIFHHPTKLFHDIYPQMKLLPKMLYPNQNLNRNFLHIY